MRTNSTQTNFRISMFCHLAVLLIAGTSHAASDLGREFSQREVQTCQETVQKNGIASHVEELPIEPTQEKATVLRISTTGNSKVNRMAADALNAFGVQIYLSPELSKGNQGLFVAKKKAIYLSDCHSFLDDTDVLEHEIMHAQLRKSMNPETSDIYFGNLNRKVRLENPDVSEYVSKGTSLEENYTFAYQLGLVDPKAPFAIDRMKFIAQTGLEINQFSIEALSELLRDVEENPDVVSMIGVGPRESLQGEPGAQLLLYLMENSNYRMIGYVSGKDSTVKMEISDRVALLKKSLQNKIRFYQSLTQSWVKVNEALKKNDISQFLKARKKLTDLSNKGL